MVRGRVAQTVYLVTLAVAPGRPGDPNRQIVAAKLTRSAAERACREWPGSWIEKVTADKE